MRLPAVAIAAAFASGILLGFAAALRRPNHPLAGRC
jgi:hypothetical protein